MIAPQFSSAQQGLPSQATGAFFLVGFDRTVWVIIPPRPQCRERSPRSCSPARRTSSLIARRFDAIALLRRSSFSRCVRFVQGCEITAWEANHLFECR